MRTLLGVLLVSMVSGDDQVTIYGDFGGSVLLPCDCPDRNSLKEFLWQKEGENKAAVFKYNVTTKSVAFCDRYKGRARVFLSEKKENCSLFLTDITAEDQERYRCKFHGTNYKDSYVYLNVSAPATAPAPAPARAPQTVCHIDSPTAVPPPAHSQEPQDRRLLWLIIIPIMLVLGLSLLLWHRWNSSQRLLRIREVETDC